MTIASNYSNQKLVKDESTDIINQIKSSIDEDGNVVQDQTQYAAEEGARSAFHYDSQSEECFS